MVPEPGQVSSGARWSLIPSVDVVIMPAFYSPPALRQAVESASRSSMCYSGAAEMWDLNLSLTFGRRYQPHPAAPSPNVPHTNQSGRTDREFARSAMLLRNGDAMEDDGFLERVRAKLRRVEGKAEIEASFADAEKLECQKFLIEFSVAAENNILPVFRSIEALRSEKIGVAVQETVASRVALTITANSEKYVVAFVPNCHARMVTVELMRGTGPIDIPHITKDYVRRMVEDTVSLIDR